METPATLLTDTLSKSWKPTLVKLADNSEHFVFRSYKSQDDDEEVYGYVVLSGNFASSQILDTPDEVVKYLQKIGTVIEHVMPLNPQNAGVSYTLF